MVFPRILLYTFIVGEVEHYVHGGAIFIGEAVAMGELLPGALKCFCCISAAVRPLTNPATAEIS